MNTVSRRDFANGTSDDRLDRCIKIAAEDFQDAQHVSLGSRSLAVLAARPLHAWFNGGHMVVAYIAYQNLTPQTKARVDALLKLNKMYAAWTKGVTAKQKGLTAFVHAATWADCIKQTACAPVAPSDGGDVPPGHQSDARNIGYSDMLMHKYWHFINLPFSAGAPGRPPKVPMRKRKSCCSPRPSPATNLTTSSLTTWSGSNISSAMSISRCTRRRVSRRSPGRRLTAAIPSLLRQAVHGRTSRVLGRPAGDTPTVAMGGENPRV
jgi:hypothetical protein